MNRFPFWKSSVLIVTCPGGLQPALSQELRAGGYEIVRETSAAVHIRGGSEEMIRANLELRTASRVLVPVVWGRARDAEELYRLVRGERWEGLIPPSHTIAVDVAKGGGAAAETRFRALRIKDAVVDAQRRAAGARSSVDRRAPDFGLVAFFDGDDVTVSLDSSGAPLHERGYRTESGQAPLRENLAAGLLYLSGWRPGIPFLDPFCGSGTIAIEAALMACDRAPGALGRRYAFERWPHVDRDEIAATRSLLEPSPPESGSEPVITAADVSRDMIEIARRNAKRAGVAEMITFEVRDFFATAQDSAAPPPDTQPGSPGMIVTNPPFGERLSVEDVKELYGQIGTVLRERYAGWDAHVLTASREAAGSLGLKIDRRLPVFNGGIECRLVGSHVTTDYTRLGSGNQERHDSRA